MLYIWSQASVCLQYGTCGSFLYHFLCNMALLSYLNRIKQVGTPRSIKTPSFAGYAVFRLKAPALQVKTMMKWLFYIVQGSSLVVRQGNPLE